MADDKNKQDGRDRAQVSAEEECELDYFAEAHGLSRDEVRELIGKHGNNREALEKAVAGKKGN
jgi:hypothetical protein